MSNISEWAGRWNIPQAAIDELREMVHHSANPGESGQSESRVQSLMRVEAAKKDIILWRNNVGAWMSEDFGQVRYGLANDSKTLNDKFKSSDLIGIKKVLITQEMVGTVIGQFVAREVKKSDWVYSGTKREQAQNEFILFCLCMGADAAFANGEGTF